VVPFLKKPKKKGGLEAKCGIPPTQRKKGGHSEGVLRDPLMGKKGTANMNSGAILSKDKRIEKR